MNVNIINQSISQRPVRHATQAPGWPLHRSCYPSAVSVGVPAPAQCGATQQDLHQHRNTGSGQSAARICTWCKEDDSTIFIFVCVCVCVCEMSIRLGGCMSSSNVTFNWGGVFFPWQSLICVEGGTKTAQTLSPTAQITATKMLELSFCLGVQVSHIHWWLTELV